MKFIFCIKKKKKVRILNKGDTLDSLTMIVAICKAIAEKIAVEKKIEIREAMELVTNIINDGCHTLK